MLPVDGQPHHLPLGDAQTEPTQLRGDLLHRDLALMVLLQHESAQLWPEMPGDTGGFRSKAARYSDLIPAMIPI